MSNLLNRLNFGGIIRAGAKMFSGAGSGLWEPTLLTDQQRPRSIVLQDTRRSYDNITWRRMLAYARQLYTSEGTVRGPVHERATLSNSGGWIPRHVGKSTPKAVRDKYEEWLWNWMKTADIRGQPFDFWQDMELASVMLDRDGEFPWIPTVNRSGDPRIQLVAPHRIYSHTSIMEVSDKDSPYHGMKINNGVVYDDQSAPVAYFVLEESLQFTLALKGRFIPVSSMQLMYKPDWCDQGRGVTAFAHAIRRIFDTDDIHGYVLIGIKRDAALPIIRKSQKGTVDKGQAYVTGGIGGGGTPITLVEGQGGEYWDVQADSKSDIIIPSSDRPSTNIPDYLENILVGVYQGIEWPYEYTRLSKEAKGANIRVTVDKVNHSVRKQFRTLSKIAVRMCGYALATAVARGELPNGEWWSWEFSDPPEMTADKYHELQESREEYKLGLGTIQDIVARRGRHWKEDVREERDEDLDDMLTRAEALQKKHPDLELQQVIDLYQQRSPNMAQVAPEPDDDESSAASDKSKPTKKKTPKGD